MTTNTAAGQQDKPWLELEEIPEIVLDELKANYKNVSFANYAQPVTEDCRTMAFKQVETLEENTTGVVLDPETFAPLIAKNIDRVRSFKIRGVFTEDSVDVYAIGSIYAVRQRPDTVTVTLEEYKKEKGEE